MKPIFFLTSFELHVQYMYLIMLDGYTSAPQTFSHLEFLIGQMAIFN